MSKAQQLKAITKRIQTLPSLPQVVQELTKMVESPDVTAKEMGRLISSDQVLSAKVLKLVNSPFYGFPGRISSISHAIILLGFNVIKGVVLSASVFDLMEKSMVGLWEHSLGAAVVSGTISRSLGLSEPEEISTGALLHDIGKVLVRVSLNEDYEKITFLVDSKGCSFREAEQEVLGVDHGEIGSWLAEEWGLPERLSIPITFHHEPENAPKLQDRVAIVHIADSIVRAFGVGSGGDGWVGQISPQAWEYVGMDEADLSGLMNQIMIDLEEVGNYQL
ncbi:MAG TPA: HDOD domain-containing protein [Deltaproteobacteria bacterium]|nr:HDOD domain-containing protein [Deltaproteobacteria bacterium]HPJ94106.1 HDOD domain-containing protein [Deltaproteobacteria bacterium]HPR52812.1 HDOD domain-containing protein [Deltaproteobacteria bacterium]